MRVEVRRSQQGDVDIVKAVEEILLDEEVSLGILSS
jgi:hypothetical protein